MMSAIKFDCLLRTCKNRNLNASGYGPLAKGKINELYDLLDPIEPISNDEYKVLYFSVGNVNFKEYKKVNAEEDLDVKEMYQYYKEDYPEKIIKEVAKEICLLVKNLSQSKLKAIKNKYSMPIFYNVAEYFELFLRK